MSVPETAITPSVARNLTGFVTAIFTAWTAAGVRFVVLRNYDDLPNHVDNDLDILVAPGQLQLAEIALVAAAKTVGYKLHNRAEFTPVCLFFHHPETLEQVQVDLFASLGLRTLSILSVEDVLGRSIPRGLFAVPHPVDEAIINLLTRLLYNGYVKEKYREGILSTFRQAPDGARSSLAGVFGDAHAELLVRSVLAEDWPAIEARASVLRRALLKRQLARNPASVLRGILRDGWRLFRRWLQPPGLSVVLLGPDGCGKSTVAPKLIQRLRHSFAPDKGLQIHWKPTVFFRKRRANRPPTTNPHGCPPRSVVPSLIFLAYHWSEYFLGALLQIRWVKFRNGLVVTDRHYYDFMVDPRRYRLNVPAWAVRLGTALLPKPDLVLLLDAPPEVLRSRKQEVPLEETRRQCEAYRALVTRLKMGRIINCAQPLDGVVADLEREVLLHLESRQQKRKGNIPSLRGSGEPRP